jgi:hypothetical protein
MFLVMSCPLNMSIILNIALRLGERTCFRHQARRREGEVLSWDPQGELFSISGPIQYIIMASEYVQPTTRLGFVFLKVADTSSL